MSRLHLSAQRSGGSAGPGLGRGGGRGVRGGPAALPAGLAGAEVRQGGRGPAGGCYRAGVERGAPRAEGKGQRRAGRWCPTGGPVTGRALMNAGTALSPPSPPLSQGPPTQVPLGAGAGPAQPPAPGSGPGSCRPGG